MISRLKKILVPVVAIVLSLLMVVPAYAYMDYEYYSNAQWEYYFHVNKVGSYNAFETRLIQWACNQYAENWGFIDYLNHPLYDLSIDGIYGSQTKADVTSWQSYCAISADGIVGGNTWYMFQYDDYDHHNENWICNNIQHWSSGRGMYYVEYNGEVRHYSDGAWYVCGSDGVTWYHVT